MQSEKQPTLIGYCKYCGSEVYEQSERMIWTGPVECGYEVEENVENIKIQPKVEKK